MNLIKDLFVALSVALCVMSSALASPGAHGPNGEHLDAPGATASADGVPRFETFTEMFELVGNLSGGQLSFLIDRYETNEPVLNASLEVEYKGMKTKAKFDADIGDYAIVDKKFLEAVSKPGKHALLFTLVAGDDSDLMEATLEVGAYDAHAHTAPMRWQWPLALLLALIALVAAVVWARRRTPKKGY
jgi:hypothetical protein